MISRRESSEIKEVDRGSISAKILETNQASITQNQTQDSSNDSQQMYPGRPINKERINRSLWTD